MGNDGGSIPKRRELVKEAARNPTAAELKETQLEQQDHLWTVDPLTNRPLAHPVVSDSLGRLFNKDSIIEFLLPAEDEDLVKRTEQEALMKGTVRSLKDVVQVNFEMGDADVSKKNGTTRAERWICPITTKELGPAAKAAYLVPCGHAFSEVALKEVAGDKCLQCNEPYAANDIIPILSVSEIDLARLTLRIKILAEKGLTHSLKKSSGSSKKRKKEDTERSTHTSMVTKNVGKTLMEAKAGQSSSGSGTATPITASGIKNPATASLTAKVLEEEEQRAKRRKAEKNDNLNSLFSAKSTNEKGKNNDFMSRGYAIPAHQHR